MSDDVGTIEISAPAALPAEPTVSVYMLAYRHERFITEAIEGVIAQQCDFPVELIIGEDCSPDRTGEIVRDYQRRYPHLIRILTSSRNVGALSNSERCILAARGRFIAICEGDDFWHHPGKLRLQVETFTGNKNITLCHTDYDRQLRFGTRRNLHRAAAAAMPAQGNAYHDLLHRWTVMTATAMYRADTLHTFLASQFHEKSWPFGDYNKALFAAANGHIAYVPESTATWRKVAGSATNENVEAYLGMALAYAECRERFLAAYPVPAEIDLSVRAESHHRVMERAFWAGRLDLFKECGVWLEKHHRKPDALSTMLKHQILKSYALTRATQLFRTFVRGLRLVAR